MIPELLYLILIKCFGVIVDFAEVMQLEESKVESVAEIMADSNHDYLQRDKN